MPRFNNTILRGQSGTRDVQINWDLPLRRWDVSHTVKDRSSLAEFIDFWMTVRGTAYSFRFWDPSDFEAGTEYQNDQIAYVDDCPTASISSTQFQLVKTYGGIVNPMTRKITKPIESTVKIYVDSVLQSSGFTLNDETGVVTFSSAPSGVVTWAGHFHCEAAFESDEPFFTLDSPQHGSWEGLTITEVR